MDYAGGKYLPMDCPSCGRSRLWAELRQGQIVVACEKCGANDWDCDEKEHEKGGPHPQHASGYQNQHQDRVPTEGGAK